ncbi:predicted protein [Chaetoceros tenuissimus]|uniref:Uncharacterized protein n=1 Tax=Chaetoceros tenuissimus TaxID=426638 RepID=A0AAD3D1U0_9STRA|nr:predicted protein [Chaetoceros tenuissimus]
MFLQEIERIHIALDEDGVVTTRESTSNIEPYVEPVIETTPGPRDTGWPYLILVLILLLYLLISWYRRRMKKKQRERAEQAELERLASLKNRIATKKFGTQDCPQSFDIEAQQKNAVNNPQECTPNAATKSNRESKHLLESSKSESDSSSFEIIKCGTEDDWQHTCAICYEQFNMEDDIGYSKNEKCCHYFHFKIVSCHG